MRMVVGCLAGTVALACSPSRVIRHNDDTTDSQPEDVGETDDHAPSGGDDPDQGDEETGNTDDDDGDGWEPKLDLGRPEPPQAWCHPGLQDCVDPELKCTAYALEPYTCCVDATKCVPIIGHKRLGEACTRSEQNDDCDKGFFCMTETSAGTGQGVCMEFCVDDDPYTCPESNGLCVPFNDGILPLCMTKCDPLAQDCEAPQACYATMQGFACWEPEPNAGQDGDECETIPGCEAGLVCVNADGLQACPSPVGCCTPFCNLTQGTTQNPKCIDPVEECVPWFDPGECPPGFEDIGYCGLPP